MVSTVLKCLTSATRLQRITNEENIIKKLLKNLILGILIICTVVTAIPVTNTQAAIKPYKKEKQLWVDIDKITPEKYIKMVHKYGKKGIKEKVQYYIGFKMNTKTEAKTITKLNNFDKKVMKAKNNKYGISMGASMDSANSDTWRKGNKIEMYTPCNDVVYMEQIIGDALNQKTYSVDGYDKNGHYTRATVYVKDLFPTVASFKKASDSVKLQFVADYMSKHCMFYAGTPKNGYDGFCFEGAASEGKCYGVCLDFRNMYIHCARMICYIDEVHDGKFRKSALNIAFDSSKYDHSVAAIYVRNSYGGFDYFEGNNSNFRTFSYPENIRNYKISLYNMYFTDRDGQSLGIVFGENTTDKAVKNYVCGKKSSEMFNICYDNAVNY